MRISFKNGSVLRTDHWIRQLGKKWCILFKTLKKVLLELLVDFFIRSLPQKSFKSSFDTSIFFLVTTRCWNDSTLINVFIRIFSKAMQLWYCLQSTVQFSTKSSYLSYHWVLVLSCIYFNEVCYFLLWFFAGSFPFVRFQLEYMDGVVYLQKTGV